MTANTSHATFYDRVQDWACAEQGMSEVAGAIFVLPFLAFLIFALVEAGVNMRYRILVENALENTVQGVSNDGAVYWSRTSAPPITETNTWVDTGNKHLADLCGASPGASGSHCKTTPTMTCTVANSTTTGATAVQVAPTAGTPVTCEAEFDYKPISPLSNNPMTSVGFSVFFNKPIKVSAQGITAVGYED